VTIVLHPAALDPQDFLSQCSLARTRGGGPGGQRRNKVQTAVRLVHRPTGLTVTATERRSSEENRKAALSRLRLKVAIDVRCPAGQAYQPSEMWRRRCRRGTVSINPRHDDFPAMIAEALDVVATCGLDMAAAAKALNCTSSQLVRILKLEPSALALVNQKREQQGLHRMV